jgi:RecJ-like exonuclease
MLDVVQCPRCDGRGYLEARLDGVEGECPLCDGYGDVDRKHLDELNQDLDDGDAFDVAGDR